MDLKAYFVRPFAETDYEALSRLRTRTSPETPTTPVEERHWDTTPVPSHFVNEKWVVEERATGEAVAFAALNHSEYSYDPHKFWVDVRVDPDHTRRGVGRALGTLLEAEAAAHQATCFWTTVRKVDARALKFSELQGFVERRTTWMSTLDLEDTGPSTIEDRSAAFEVEGIRFTTLAEEGPRRPEVRQRLFELMDEASRDVPRLGAYTPPPFAQFSAELDGPNMMPEAFFLACYGETYVACSNLEKDLARSDSLGVGFTGTRVAYRGRGLATELKRRSLDYARRSGVRFLRTFNDSLNQPIGAINEKIGFRRTVEWSSRERLFRTETAAAPPAL